jgi:hypothetical protein
MRRSSSAGSHEVDLVYGDGQENPTEIDQAFHGQVAATIKVAVPGFVGRL